MHIHLLLFGLASIILAVTHIISLELFLYWRYWWLDLPMHILGGSVVALGMWVAHSV